MKIVRAAVHGDKLGALVANPKLPPEDAPRVQEAIRRYGAWIKRLESAKGDASTLLGELVAALNDYKRYIELDFIFDADNDFLYRQKGQLKLDNTVLEEFLPYLFDSRLCPGLSRLPNLICGPQSSFAGAVVLGCACFSAISVYKFGCAAFGDARKALGFTITLEGVMLVSTGATSNVALAVLILINAVANGSVIALAREATCKRRAADQRRAATRAKNRSSRPRSQPVPVTAGPLVKVPTWSPVEDAVDAEIVSEEELYS